MRLSIGLRLGSTALAGGVSVSINGLSSGQAVVGTHASITMSVSEGTITARKWGSTSGGSEYGTGTNPTDFTAGLGSPLYATATVDGEDYTTSALIVSAASALLLEIDDFLLLENGDQLLLEA